MENKILIKEIKKLKKITPSTKWVDFSKNILLQQINPQNSYHYENIGFGGYVYLFVNTFRQRLLEPAIVMLLVLATFLGSSLGINAAFYSLPGERLYNVKLALEKTHMALTSEERKVELQVEFVQKRVAEFEKIVSNSNIEPEDKRKRVQTVTKEFNNNITVVNNHLTKINETIRQQQEDEIKIPNQQKEKTLQMAASLSEKTKELTKSFNEKMTIFSEEDPDGAIDITVAAEVVETDKEVDISTAVLEGENNKDELEEKTVKEEGEIKGVEFLETEEIKKED